MPHVGPIDRLIVFGVKSSMSAAASAEHVAQLLDAQHYTRGLAFVRQGTPTNNTGESTAGFPPDDAGGRRSFAVERGPQVIEDGARLTRALGIDSSVVEHVDGAGL